MTKLSELLLPGAEAVVARYRELYEAELKHVNAMIAESKASHSSMPNNYWHKCHELRGKYILAIQLRDSYKELLEKDDPKKT